jgi:MoxR-like ATPase
MDQSSFINSDPSILLLNEIEILLAQTRLMELYLKQAQATAANEAARVNQQHQAELATLRAALPAKEKIPPIVAPTPNTRRLEAIESDLSANRLLLNQRDREPLQRKPMADCAAKSPNWKVRQLAQKALESAKAKRKFTSRTGSPAPELEAKRHEFAEQQRDAREIGTRCAGSEHNYRAS